MTERLFYECLLGEGWEFPLPGAQTLVGGPGVTRVRVFVEALNEVPGLEVGDVNLQRETVTFRPTAARRLKTPGSHRTVPLWPQLREILSAHLKGPHAPSGPLLFPSQRTGEALTDVRKVPKSVRHQWGQGPTAKASGPMHDWLYLRHIARTARRWPRIVPHLKRIGPMKVGQRIAAATLLMERVSPVARQRQRSGKKVKAGAFKGKASVVAAEFFFVSARAVEYAAAIRRKHPRIFAELAHGKITLTRARRRGDGPSSPCHG